MFKGITTHSLTERKAMQRKYGTETLPFQDLCYCTYTSPNGEEKIICDVLGTDPEETQAVLSYEENGKRAIWHAYRDQSGAPGTWLWTEEQLEEAKRNPVRISEEDNNFDFRGDSNAPIGVAPIHKDRRTEILLVGQQLGKSDEEVREKLRSEGLDDTLPENYRTEQGELDLLKQF